MMDTAQNNDSQKVPSVSDPTVPQTSQGIASDNMGQNKESSSLI